jgi:hypothetical protein
METGERTRKRVSAAAAMENRWETCVTHSLCYSLHGPGRVGVNGFRVSEPGWNCFFGGGLFFGIKEFVLLLYVCKQVQSLV